jgi:DNA-binding LacI/PurR family transcriptional regulator
MSKKQVSSVDVARAAGVSQSAVSRAFSNAGGVSEKTRAKIIKAAQSLGYSPNALARSLITNHSNMIGMVMGEVTNPFYPEVLQAFSTRLQEQGHRIMLFTVPPGGDVDDVLPEVLQYRPEGVVITSARLSSTMAEECARRNTRVVLFNRSIHGAPVWSVCCDNVAGGRLVADLLVDGGHRKPAYLAGLENTSTNLDRERGFNDRLHDRGFPPPLRMGGDYTYDGGYGAAKFLLNQPDRPDALFCANDIMALGAMDAARREFALNIPDDLAIVGFDDIAAAGWPSYDLTTVRQRVNMMVDETIRILMAGEKKISDIPFTQLVPGDLVIRGSLRPPPGVTRGRYPTGDLFQAPGHQ